MSLRDLELKISYNSGEDNLAGEFFIPCLQNSVKYDRAVGFFTSEALFVISRGLHEFVRNSRTMRLVCSPRLKEEDIKAIEKGYKDRDNIIYGALLSEINRLPGDIVNDSINFLSWLIAVNKIDIKIALPKRLTYDSYGIYHEKIGLFYDALQFFWFPLSIIYGKLGLILHRLFSSDKRFICSELIAAGFYKEGDYLFNKPQQNVLPADFDNAALFEEVKDIWLPS